MATPTKPSSRPLLRGRRRGGRRDDGGYAIALTALLLVPMLLMSALAVDVGTWYARITVLQRAADAAALAGTIWMPDLTKATAVAGDSLKQNGINPDGSSGVTVVIGQGQSATSLRVALTQNKATTYFSQVIGWKQSLSRSAEAEYYLPLPLGSPLNYFGGDASKNTTTTTTTPPSDATTNKPTNSQQCKFSTDSTKGYSNGSYITRNVGSRWSNCTWQVTSTAQIDPSRSPGFWAAIGGPGDVAAYGDAFSAVCTGSINCGSPVKGNNMYRDSGYWYVIKMPAANTSSTTISIYDASYDPNNGSSDNAGDTAHGDSTVFNTEYRIFKQNGALDINDRTPLATAASATDGSCYWKLQDNADFLTRWRPLCTISSPEAGATYLLNVRTTYPSYRGAGVNGYAVQAIATGSTQPAVYAYGDMGMRNNVSGTEATFYLAEVGPEFAGKVLNIDLWDPGDANDTATLYPMMPSSSAAKPVVSVAQSDCTYTASPSPNAVITNSGAAGGKTGTVVSTAHSSDVSGRCGVITNTGGSSGNKYNDEWLHLRIKVPSTYTCTKGVNPETTAGSCWWGIQYEFAGASNDVTTWKANIEGNPVHLVQ